MKNLIKILLIICCLHILANSDYIGYNAYKESRDVNENKAYLARPFHKTRQIEQKRKSSSKVVMRRRKSKCI